MPDSFALAHAAISWQPTATAAGSSPPGWQPTDTYQDSEELSKQLHPPSPQPCGVLPGIPRGVFPFPPLPLSQGTSATSVRGAIGGKNASMSNTQPSRHRCKPRDHPTIVIPRLQISDLTLYPFWFSSGLILSGCEQRQRQLRDRDGPNAMPTLTSEGSFMVAGQGHLVHATSLLPGLSWGQIWSYILAGKGRQ